MLLQYSSEEEGGVCLWYLDRIFACDFSFSKLLLSMPMDMLQKVQFASLNQSTKIILVHLLK